MSRNQASSRITADSKKVNAELFVLTYGTLVHQLVRDYETPEEVNKQLDRMGYNIGLRLIEDFLARTNYPRCTDLRDTAEKIQTAFKMYLNVSPSLDIGFRSVKRIWIFLNPSAHTSRMCVVFKDA